LQTAFEEVAHYVTGATDMSRDFQNFLIQCIVEIVVSQVRAPETRWHEE
jgi:hypothetical protein